MMKEPVSYPQPDRWSYLWIVIGALLTVIGFVGMAGWAIIRGRKTRAEAARNAEN